MKRRTVKTKMRKLVSIYLPPDGKKRKERARIAVAKRLDISPWSVYYFAKGSRKPGIHLYDAILRLCEEMEAKNE